MIQTVHIGYRYQREDTTDGVENGNWVNDVLEISYIARCVRPVQRNYNSDTTINETKKMTLDVTILNNPFMEAHLQDVEYIKLRGGSKWQIQSIELKAPNYTFNLGGIYSG